VVLGVVSEAAFAVLANIDDTLVDPDPVPMSVAAVPMA